MQAARFPIASATPARPSAAGGNAGVLPTRDGQGPVLVVAALPIVREPLAACLRQAGFGTCEAAGARTALAAARGAVPCLVLLDLALPDGEALALLRAVRVTPALAAVPVVLLADAADRRGITEAAKLGVQDCVLRSQFSLDDLLARVRRRALPRRTAGPRPDRTPAAGPARAAASAAVPVRRDATATASPPDKPSTAGDATGPVPVPQLLTREDCLKRAQAALQGKTLSGVVAEVIAMAASPRTDTAQLAAVIGRDPMLAARVLNAANSAAYGSAKGVVTAIPDAVRTIGCATVRNVAASVGIFEAMPATCPDGFNPIRCWQHSFAVAKLCERLAAAGGDPASAGTAYLVGLCHDLGEILFHTHFGTEYRAVLAAHRQAGGRRADVERQVLGMTHGELVLTILKDMGLPDTIRRPVEAVHAARTPADLHDPLARVLALADAYANGALLASGPSAPVGPLTRAACKAAAGAADPTVPDAEALRAEVYCLTALLARLAPRDEQELMRPLVGRRKVRVALARERGFSAFDPVGAALASLAAEVAASESMPSPDDAAGADALVVVARTPSAAGFTAAEIAACRERAGRADLPVLWLTGLPGGDPAHGDLAPRRYPVPLDDLVAFLDAAFAARGRSNPPDAAIAA